MGEMRTGRKKQDGVSTQGEREQAPGEKVKQAGKDHLVVIMPVQLIFCPQSLQ